MSFPGIPSGSCITLQNELHKNAVETFRIMYCSLAINPDRITLVSVLSACEDLNLLALGKSIQYMILKHLLASNLRVKIHY